MTLDDYFRLVDGLLSNLDIAYARQVSYDKRSHDTGFVRGQIIFVDGSVLHLREFVAVEQQIERYTYAYHYQRSDGSLIFRYDRTPHFPYLPNFPHHKHVHVETNVISASEPDLFSVIDEIRRFFLD